MWLACDDDEDLTRPRMAGWRSVKVIDVAQICSLHHTTEILCHLDSIHPPYYSKDRGALNEESNPSTSAYSRHRGFNPLPPWVGKKMDSAENIPFYDSLASIYDPTILQQQKQRYQNLYNEFQNTYHSPPKYIVRAPGRVNLIVPLTTSHNLPPSVRPILHAEYQLMCRANISIIVISPCCRWRLPRIFLSRYKSMKKQ